LDGMRAGLERALRHREIIPYYQPVVDLDTGRITSFEALARWVRPDGEVVEPADFIPAAEASGLIVPLGERMLRLACRQAAAWLTRGFGPFSIAVNISAHQLYREELPGRVLEVLARSGLDPRRLELEITESVIMKDTALAAASLNRLIAAGVSVAIDDFGTGYSSLSSIMRFPVGRIKIDRSFVGDLDVNEDNAAIVRAVVSMAKNLRLGVTAEGVETAEQVKFLRAIKAPAAQGFYFSRPLPAGAFERLMPG
jgi:EAL domain-containing protein (putative c-di-GMP-specific phosphodiesterase class I)